MRISILVENTPGTWTQAEHGLSYLVEYDSGKILFDTGQSELFLQNAAIMNVKLDDIDLIVLSHGHYDHGNGLRFLERGKLLCHPDCFLKRYGNRGKKYIGLGETKKDLLDRFELISSSDAYRISDKVYFLGGIPRISAYESQSTTFTYSDGSPDFVPDDSALALVTDKGIFVVTGCGHSGVINTFERARKATGIDKLYGIIGGFHLKHNNRQTKETIKYLKRNRVEHVYASHCTALPALCAFHREFGSTPPKTGDILEF